MDFLFALLFIAVLKRVHDAFMYRQTYLVLIVLAKARRRSHAHTHLFGEGDAIEQRLQYDFDPLRF